MFILRHVWGVGRREEMFVFIQLCGDGMFVYMYVCGIGVGVEGV